MTYSDKSGLVCLAYFAACSIVGGAVFYWKKNIREDATDECAFVAGISGMLWPLAALGLVGWMLARSTHTFIKNTEDMWK